MRSEHLEAWVLSIVDQVIVGRRVEDSRVELKADWPEPKAAARRIAAHGNAAGTDSVLWIVGLDETNGVTQVTPTDLADWLSKVVTEFDGLAPALNDLLVPTPAGPVVALLFEVSRRPFVVKNAVFGQKGGGAVSLEVPWRRGTAVHTARRDELLRVLVPRQALPSVELLEASAEVGLTGPVNPAYGGQPLQIQRFEHLAWSFHLTLYVTPHSADLLVLPTHKTTFIFAFGSEEPRVAAAFRFFTPYRTVGSAESVVDSSTVMASAGEAVLRGPGLLHGRASHHEAVRSLPSNVGLAATLVVSPAGTDLRTETVFQLRADGEQSDHKRRWQTDQQGAVSEGS
jgi:hypothetical protein